MGISRRAKMRERKKNITAFILIAVFALTVFSINSVGRFIAEKVISPLMNMGGKEQTLTDNLSSGEITYYMLSSETCASATDAEKAKSAVSDIDGSGYIFVSDSGFLPLILCSANSDFAEIQRSIAAEKFSSASVTEVTLPEINIKITGTKEQVNTVKEAFSALSGAIEDMLNIGDGYENGNLTKLQACGNISKIANIISDTEASLNAIESKNSAVTALKDICMCLKTLTDEAPKSGDADFLKKLRYTVSAFVCEYTVFCTELG